MPHRQPLPRRLRTAARWPVGVALTSWRYLWRLTPVDRWEWSDSEPEAGGEPEIPAVPDLQPPAEGAGPMVHRLYRIRIADAKRTPEELMAAIGQDLDAVAPSEFASFQKVGGEKGALRVGDEYVVRMPGPWDGPVRVVAADPDGFRLATLQGHLEAGQIEWRARIRDGLLEFTLESWARSGDRLSDVLYSHLRIAKEVQLHMWISVLERVERLSGGRRVGPLAVVTRRSVADDPGDEETGLTGPANRRARRGLAALEGRPLNFDPGVDPASEEGWHQDMLSWTLPPEAPGAPVPGGSWEVARRLMIDYQVADPALVRATYRTGSPLSGRDMLLQIRYHGFRVYVGVRIDDVYDEGRTVDGKEVRVFGWSYSTLQGHIERGRLHYEVWKWAETGVVEFRLRAFSRAAEGGSRLLRVGFRLVGRTNQLDFYRRAGRRISRFTQAQLELDRD